MLSSKQRAQLRSIASTTEVVFQVGKGGISDTLIKQVEDALLARELIKLSANETIPEDIKKIAQDIADATDSILVQVIGRKMVFYKEHPQKDKRQIKLVK